MIPNDPLPRVLVIEDEAKIRKFLRAALEAHHYDFAEAATAKDGILQASLRPPIWSSSTSAFPTWTAWR